MHWLPNFILELLHHYGLFWQCECCWLTLCTAFRPAWITLLWLCLQPVRLLPPLLFAPISHGAVSSHAPAPTQSCLWAGNSIYCAVLGTEDSSVLSCCNESTKKCHGHYAVGPGEFWAGNSHRSYLNFSSCLPPSGFK